VETVQKIHHFWNDAILSSQSTLDLIWLSCQLPYTILLVLLSWYLIFVKQIHLLNYKIICTCYYIRTLISNHRSWWLFLKVEDIVVAFNKWHEKFEVVPSIAAYEKVISTCCNSLQVMINTSTPFVILSQWMIHSCFIHSS
jgi:hypothetical protein